MPISTLPLIHSEISHLAANKANRDTRLKDWLPEGLDASPVFRSASDSREGGGFSLSIHEAILSHPDLGPGTLQRDAFVTAMNQIATEAVKNAIVEKGRLFAGALIGEGRQGRNYFKR